MLNRSARKIPLPTATENSPVSLRSGSGSTNATTAAQPENVAEKTGSQYHDVPRDNGHGSGLCPGDRDSGIRYCRECRKPYRTGNPGYGGLCPKCYYLIYDDDED